MNTDSHVQSSNIELVPNFVDSFYHGYSEQCNIVGLFLGALPVIVIQKAHYHITVPNGVYFVQVQARALLVERSEELGQHFNHFSSPIIIGELCKAHYISEEKGNIFVDSSRLHSWFSDLFLDLKN